MKWSFWSSRRAEDSYEARGSRLGQVLMRDITQNQFRAITKQTFLTMLHFSYRFAFKKVIWH
jgi:hypothetical protein